MTVYEPDDWRLDGANIMSNDELARVAAVLERSVVVVEHRHYRRASSPTRLFFEANHEFLSYLKKNAQPGDRFCIWSFEDVCRDDNMVADAKYPDSAGRVPRKGAY